MPLFQTDITEGQTAALNQQLNPLRANEEAKQLPIQTQLLQQKLQKGQLDSQKETLELQAFMQGQKDDAATRSAVEQYATDPANKDKPTSKKMEELATLVGGKGNIKAMEALLNHSATAAEREERMTKLAREKDQHDLAGINRVITTATPDNLAEKELELQNYGFDPKLVKQFVDSAEAAKRAGMLPQYLAEAKKHFDSDASKKEREIEAKDRETRQSALDRIAEQQHRDELMNNRLIATINARNSKDTVSDKDVAKVAMDIVKQSESTYRDANSVLKNIRVAKEKLGPRPFTGGIYTRDSVKEAAADWDKQNQELKEEETTAKEAIQRSKKDRENAMGNLPPKMAKLVIPLDPVESSNPQQSSGNIGEKKSFKMDEGFKPSKEQVVDINAAVEAINKGAPKDKVLERLRKAGIKVSL